MTSTQLPAHLSPRRSLVSVRLSRLAIPFTILLFILCAFMVNHVMAGQEMAHCARVMEMGGSDSALALHCQDILGK